MLLSIETSCDESAVAVFDDSGALLCDLISSQVELHVPYGGVVPELAARAHLDNLPALVDEAARAVPGCLEQLQAVCVTQGPGLKGCLLVGMSFAKGLAYRAGVPVVAVNHLEGHLLAGALLPPESRPRFPFLALLVSGGHTLVALVKGFRDYELLAETKDDAVGEAFDKCAMLLGLSYPGGPALSKLAEGGDERRFSFPVGIPDDDRGFSFSGLKTAVLREIQKQKSSLADGGNEIRRDLAAAIETALVRSLVPKTVLAAKRTGVREVLITGGVAANRRLREELPAALTPLGVRTIVLPQRWCGDNAAMIGVVGRELLAKGAPEPGSWHSLDVQPRFPLGELA